VAGLIFSSADGCLCCCLLLLLLLLLSLLLLLQELVNPAWKVIADGCHLNR
jgi:hypothetical protein